MASATRKPTKNSAAIPLDSLNLTTLSRLYSDQKCLADCLRVVADDGQAVRKVLEQCNQD